MDDRMETEIGNDPAQVVDRKQLQYELSEARDALVREVDRLDTLEVRMDLAERLIRRLESLSLEGVLASLRGTKAGKLDALRQECESLEREHEACAQAIQPLQRAVDDLAAQFASLPAPATSHDLSAESEDCEPVSELERLERAIEAGESLLSHLTGTQRSCSKIRGQSNILRAGGPLISAALNIYKSKVADGLTSQVGSSVRYFCSQVNRLAWCAEDPADVETLATLAQLKAFADSSGQALNARTEGWLELEVIARSLVSDLQDKLSNARAGRA